MSQPRQGGCSYTRVFFNFFDFVNANQAPIETPLRSLGSPHVALDAVGSTVVANAAVVPPCPLCVIVDGVISKVVQFNLRNDGSSSSDGFATLNRLF